MLFVLGLITGLLFALCTDLMLKRSMGPDDLVLFGRVHDLAMADYVSEVESRELMDNALAGMLEGLDTHSRFYSSAELEGITRETSGEFRGIGVVFRQPTSEGQVLFPFPGSPAARSGLEVGDRLIRVHDQVVAELEPGQLQAMLRSRGAEPIDVLVESLGGLRQELRVFPDDVQDPTVRHGRILDPELGIGYLAVLAFTKLTAVEFDAAMLELKGRGMRRLILDLRFNPGGVLESAVKIANRFIAAGVLVSRETRHESFPSMADPNKAIFAGMPLVVLVNGGSASASEILAGAVQDHCVGTLVGVPTYGKGTVQTLQRLANNRGMLKFTTAKYFTPAHRGIERIQDDRTASGISPELFVPNSAEQRQALRRYLARYSAPLSVLPAIERWEQAEGLELIAKAPEDRQLEAALDLLQGLAPDAEHQEALR